ncbi:MAG: transglutaminase-like cysteine peptidase [Proteobacteria bacterium]|nr:transglutaminase-like cysteine peptidase [Pseudomonadota bacterium]
MAGLLVLALPLCQAGALDLGRFELAARRLGATAPARDLEALLSRLAGADDAARLLAVNDFFNRRIVYADDMQVWGQVDYWASPLEMLSRGRGDCEDYVIGKYFSLIALGMPAARLRLVYVRARIGGSVQAHMVLAYYAAPGAEPLILDNLVPDVTAASRRPDLEPVFSFNGDGLWQGTGTQTAGDPVLRLSRWRDVLAKAREEGFMP